MSHLLPAISRIIARRPAQNFADGITTSEHLGTPDYALAIIQYETYLNALSNLGLALSLAPADDRFPDGHFVEDPLIIFHDVAFMCRSGAEARREEGHSLLQYLPNLKVIQADEDALIDGGDVLICSDRVLVGLSARTNQAGVDSLRNALQTVKSDIRVDAVAFSGVLHLKSGLTELAPNVLIHDPALKTDYALDWAQVHTLPPEEGYAADVMPVNDSLFIAKGFPTALGIAKQYYQQIIELDMSEFRKMDGGLTCLSLRF